MSKMLPAAGAALALALFATAATADSDGGVNVRTAMVEGVNPAALAIWDVGNNALDDEGMPDPAQLDATKIKAVAEAAQTLAAYADLLATADPIRAAGPDLVGGKLPKGVASREQIQAMIDADPAGFRKLAGAMGDEARGITAAIGRDDLDDLANRLATFDGACQACHENYWYAQVEAGLDQPPSD